MLQLHYHRTGRVEKDRTSMGIYFSKKRENRRLRDVTVPGHFLYVPAGNDRFKVEGTIWIRQDCEIHNVMPHMHLLGRNIKMTMTPPEGKTQTLVDIRDWDFDWQELYFPRAPIRGEVGHAFRHRGNVRQQREEPAQSVQPAAQRVHRHADDQRDVRRLFMRDGRQAGPRALRRAAAHPGIEVEAELGHSGDWVLNDSPLPARGERGRG